MNITQCKMCKKPFHTIGSRICPECLNQIDMDYLKVRDFVYDNPGADIDTTAAETKVDKAVILHLLKEGRLTLSNVGDVSGSMLMCEVCRKPIVSGRMCEMCKSKVAATMNKSVESHKPPPPPKKDANAKSTMTMHTRSDKT